MFLLWRKAVFVEESIREKAIWMMDFEGYVVYCFYLFFLGLKVIIFTDYNVKNYLEI